MTVEGGPSVLFDAVVLLPSAEGTEALLGMAAAVNWLRDAFGHLKAIGYNEEAQPLFDKASSSPTPSWASCLWTMSAGSTPSLPPPRSIKSGTGRNW